MSDIVVLAFPYSVFLQSDSYNYRPDGGTLGGAPLAVGYAVHQEMTNKTVVEVEPDASNPEIVVTAEKLRFALIDSAIKLSIIAAQVTNFAYPCIGTITNAELASNARNMKITLSNADFGTGRAGENRAGSSGNAVPVVMNAGSAKVYTDYTNGAIYVIAHEIAHSLSSMQVYNNQKWLEFIATQPAGTPQATLVANYPNSPQFAANEARANTVARAIAAKIGASPMIPDPTFGYQVC